MIKIKKLTSGLYQSFISNVNPQFSLWFLGSWQETNPIRIWRCPDDWFVLEFVFWASPAEDPAHRSATILLSGFFCFAVAVVSFWLCFCLALVAWIPLLFAFHAFRLQWRTAGDQKKKHVHRECNCAATALDLHWILQTYNVILSYRWSSDSLVLPKVLCVSIQIQPKWRSSIPTCHQSVNISTVDRLPPVFHVVPNWFFLVGCFLPTSSTGFLHLIGLVQFCAVMILVGLELLCCLRIRCWFFCLWWWQFVFGFLVSVDVFRPGRTIVLLDNCSLWREDRSLLTMASLALLLLRRQVQDVRWSRPVSKKTLRCSVRVNVFVFDSMQLFALVQHSNGNLGQKFFFFCFFWGLAVLGFACFVFCSWFWFLVLFVMFLRKKSSIRHHSRNRFVDSQILFALTTNQLSLADLLAQKLFNILEIEPFLLCIIGINIFKNRVFVHFERLDGQFFGSCTNLLEPN